MSDTTDSMQSLTSLTVLNATAALERGLAAIQAGQRAFDLCHVLTVDSAAVSVMLSWQRAASEAGFQLELKNTPPALQSLTKLYGVCSLVFPGQAPAAEPASGLANAPADLHHH